MGLQAKAHPAFCLIKRLLCWNNAAVVAAAAGRKKHFKAYGMFFFFLFPPLPCSFPSVFWLQMFFENVRCAVSHQNVVMSCFMACFWQEKVPAVGFFLMIRSPTDIFGCLSRSEVTESGLSANHVWELACDLVWHGNAPPAKTLTERACFQQNVLLFCFLFKFATPRPRYYRIHQYTSPPAPRKWHQSLSY